MTAPRVLDVREGAIEPDSFDLVLHHLKLIPRKRCMASVGRPLQASSKSSGRSRSENERSL